MNILQLTNIARDLVTKHSLQNKAISVNVSRSASTLSKKPEITVVLANFDNEEELVAFGNNMLGLFRVERFGSENQIPYVFYRAFLDDPEFLFIVSMLAPYGVRKSQVFTEPVSTTFSALSRAK